MRGLESVTLKRFDLWLKALPLSKRSKAEDHFGIVLIQSLAVRSYRILDIFFG